MHNKLLLDTVTALHVYKVNRFIRSYTVHEYILSEGRKYIETCWYKPKKTKQISYPIYVKNVS